ncbi:MAG: NYN domain-containing protein, partial [Chloroflexota bacterium]
MNGSAKVGLFIDLENLRYELLKRGREFDPQRLIQKARKYGLVKVAYAYADFTKQPELLQGKFEASMIKRVDVPLRLRDDGRLKSSADLHMVMDIFET